MRRAHALSILTGAVVAPILLAVTLSTSSVSAATNLVANPGFETGSLSPWTCDAGTAQVVTSPVHSGSYALAGTPTSNLTAQCSQTISVQPSTSYTLSAWVLGNYAYIGDTGTGTSDTSNWVSTSTWQQLSTTFNTGASTTSVKIWVHGWYNQGTVYSDDFLLTGPAGPTTTTTAPPPPTTTTTTAPPPTTTTTTSSGGGGGSLPKHVLDGYWQDFTNGATPLKLASVPTSYNIISAAFATSTSTAGQVAFSVDSGLSSALGGYTDAQFISDVQTVHSRGQKVVLSVGGANGTVSISDSTSANNFASSVYSLMKQYGFDGVDIDLESGINVTYLTQALKTLSANAGPSLIITLAPQTIDVQSTGGSYFQLALNIKSILTIMNTQYYNSGTMNGCDGNVYAQATENFLTALACIQLQGGLSPSQVGLGLPASTSAAGGGYVSPGVVNNALDCLARGTNCGTFKPSATYPAIRGAMTWSINWDASNNYNFANTVAPHLSTLP